MIRNIVNWTPGPGIVDSYTIYRSTTPMLENSLPSPIATGITTNEYIDTNVTANMVYYYRVEAVKDIFKRLSAELKVQTISQYPELNLSIPAMAFWMLDEISGDYIDRSGNSRHLVASINALRGLPPIDPLAELCSATDIEKSTEKWIGKYNGSISVGSSFTFMCWISIPNSTVTLGGEFFKLGYVGQGFSVGFNNNDNGLANGRYLLVGQNGIAFRPTSYLFSNDSQNAHIAVRWLNGTLAAFVNGSKVYSQSIGYYNSSSDVFGVGVGENDIIFKMPMSRVAVYNGALTDDEILKIAKVTQIQR